ncbi:MAG TPA: response regulator [Thermoanaerobaculia bacterium]
MNPGRVADIRVGTIEAWTICMLCPKVLVVDDDDAIRHLVATILKREQCYDVHTASGGIEALSKMALTAYDVVVLDLMMPDLSGADVLEAIALRDPLTRCVVLMSAASPLALAESVTPNVCVTVRKPFDIDALLNAVKGCVQASHEPAAPPKHRRRVSKAA